MGTAKVIWISVVIVVVAIAAFVGYRLHQAGHWLFAPLPGEGPIPEKPSSEETEE